MLIEHLINFYDANPTFPLRFLISSRVEEHIRTRLETPQVHLLDLVNYAADADIAIVVDATFDRAAKHDRLIQAHGEWPTPNDKRGLIKAARSSFILLSMLLRFVLSPAGDGQTAMGRLALAVDGKLGGLDEIYMRTLMQSKHLPHFSLIVSTLALLPEPLPIFSLAILLDIKEHEVVQVLNHLRPIIQVSGDDFTPVLFFHASVREFLVTKSRSGRFHASPDQKQVALHMKKISYLSASNLAVPPQTPSHWPYVLLGYVCVSPSIHPDIDYWLQIYAVFLQLIARPAIPVSGRPIHPYGATRCREANITRRPRYVDPAVLGDCNLLDLYLTC